MPKPQYRPPQAYPHHMVVPALGQASHKIYRTETEQTTNATGESYSTTRVLETGTEQFIYEVHIDNRALQALTQKAAANKGGRAKAGPISIKVITRGKTQHQ